MRSVFKIVACLVLLQWGSIASAQDMQEYERRMNLSTNRSMAVLGGWAIGNIIAGGILLPGTGGSERYFHQMNLGWNIVNLGIAASGWLGSRRSKLESDQAIIRKHERMRQILLFNAGLDLGYVAAGGWMMERAQREAASGQRLKGFGQSLILQGGFLFLFDLGTFLVLDSRHRAFDLRCTTTSDGVSMIWKF